MTPTAAEPFMPAEGIDALENLAFDLAREASQLSAQLHPIVRLSVGDLVRSMNCYYSNLIEGHNTHPRDIDRALVRFTRFGATFGRVPASIDGRRRAAEGRRGRSRRFVPKRTDRIHSVSFWSPVSIRSGTCANCWNPPNCSGAWSSTCEMRKMQTGFPSGVLPYYARRCCRESWTAAACGRTVVSEVVSPLKASAVPIAGPQAPFSASAACSTAWASRNRSSVEFMRVAALKKTTPCRGWGMGSTWSMTKPSMRPA